MTARAYSFFAASLIFYFFANQTQIGWLYVISALLAGLVLASWRLNRTMLNGIDGERIIFRQNRVETSEVDMPQRTSGEKFHEADAITIRLSLYHRRRLPSIQVSVTEVCPLAPIDTPERTHTLFVPVLPATGVQFHYNTEIDRRGIHRFPALQLKSRAPFGFYRRHSTLNLATSLLVYPEVRSLSHLALLDRQPSAQMTYPKAGQGSEILGVRPYRTGDSPRHIHWRSVARTGQLMSKEFAEEKQPGITLFLDRHSPYNPQPETKHTAFEMAVKCAASIAEYALNRRYALYMSAAENDMALPSGALLWEHVLEYLAKVTPQITPALPDLLARQPVQQYVAAIIAYPDIALIEPLVALHRRGIHVLAVLCDPASFPTGGDSILSITDSLQAAGIETRLIRYGDNWTQILSEK